MCVYIMYIYIYIHTHTYSILVVCGYIFGGGERVREGGSERTCYFKGLAHVIVGTRKSEVHRAGQQGGRSDKS